MGRAKTAMKYIQDENPRKVCFRQRKKGLKSKISQITKSGAKACLVMYDENNEGPMTWPEDLATVNSMLQEYEHQKIDKTPKVFDVNDYFRIKKNMVKAGITKVHKDIISIKYPTWHPHFNKMDENQLRNFMASIDVKIRACNHKISTLKSS
ncbi:agamous-like MADS-box protein AGL80 [Trifolium pratense]|uniref:agamous-like MADS-box protein AGL80 n=1 Tax=Trifolium pratense TaxID=57577 RepID=UPI001E69312E|nr:agamous-like MADS-box protein AGL80 [Trifolium pratense]